MNALDIIIIIILIVAGISGLRKGIISQACGIAGLLLGILLAFPFSSRLSQWLHVAEGFSWLLSFVIILLAVILVLWLVGWLVKKLVSAVGLGFIDRIGGFILGVVKWGLVLSLLVGLLANFARATDVIDPEKITGAKLYAPLEKLGDKVFPYILDAKEKYLDPELNLDGERDNPEEESGGDGFRGDRYQRS